MRERTSAKRRATRRADAELNGVGVKAHAAVLLGRARVTAQAQAQLTGAETPPLYGLVATHTPMESTFTMVPAGERAELLLVSATV